MKEIINWEEYEELFNNTKEFKNINDPKRHEAPKENGLYLVSNTLFNPLTNEQYYLVKVGESSNLYNRMRTYRTTNPMLFHIDYFVVNTEYYYELQCHNLMMKKGFMRMENSTEWFVVDKESYLEICEKGFSYFNEVLPLRKKYY